MPKAELEDFQNIEIDWEGAIVLRWIPSSLRI